MTFASLGLSAPILKAVTEQGYETPSPIQAKAIPAVLEGLDVMAAAQTGTGKTAGFTLPLLEKLSDGPKAGPNEVRALVLTPTRELAAQVAESVATYGKHLRLKSTVVFGGVKINPQMMKLCRGSDVLVATPGRLLDLYNQKAVRFKQLEVLVLDEADRMLDMGFIHDIRRILALLPKQRQNLMFSATFSDDIRALAKTIVHDPVEISVTPPNSTVKSVKQWIHAVDKKQKPHLLIKEIKRNQWNQVLIFTRTKHGANKLTRQLNDAAITAAAIHGNKSQGARTRALAEFKSGDIQALVATDIAARGLDIDQLPQVVNFDLPNVPEDYVHRIGRTGRAGAEGQAISLVCIDEIKQLSDIQNLIQESLERKPLEGYHPVNALPETRIKPRKAQKPKKPKKISDKEGNAEKGAKGKQGVEKKTFKPNRKPAADKRGSGKKTEGGKTSDGSKARVADGYKGRTPRRKS